MASGPSVSGTVHGRVDSFDDPEGYGTVTADEPAGTWFFHCTAIADGTRTIEVGADGGASRSCPAGSVATRRPNLRPA